MSLAPRVGSGRGLTLARFPPVTANPPSFARPFQSFRSRSSPHTIEYDASLTGMGVLVWQGRLVGRPRVLLGFAVLPSPFTATTDSSFQNTYEYLAILLGLLLSKTLGLRDFVFSVLQGRARSMLCRRASISFSILAVNVAASILETEYVPSKQNVVCDGLQLRTKKNATPTNF